MTRIIAEIGWNHMGDMALAKRMIEEAASNGATHAKFQSWSVSNLKPGEWDIDGRREIYENAQLSFADHELTSYGYLGGSDFKRASTLTEATLIFMRKFENPATVGGTSVDGASKRSGEDDRLKQAASIFNNYTFSGGSV